MMSFGLGFLGGFALCLCFFRLIDGCWPWSRDRDLFAEEDAKRENEMGRTNQMNTTYPVAHGNSGFSKSHVVVEGSGGAGSVGEVSVGEYASGGGGGYSGDEKYIPPMIEVQLPDGFKMGGSGGGRSATDTRDEERFTSEEQLDAGNWPEDMTQKPDPLAR